MTMIGSIPLTPNYQPLDVGRQTQAVNQQTRLASDSAPVLPSGNHIDFLVQQHRDLYSAPNPNNTATGKTAGESLRWLMHHSDAGSLTDAVHSQLLRSFLVENGLAVTSSQEDIAVTQTPETKDTTDEVPKAVLA